MANKKLRIIYRSNSHAPLWLVADKSGVWGNNGLDVDTSPQLVREKAVEALERHCRCDLRQSSQPLHPQCQGGRLRPPGAGD